MASESRAENARGARIPPGGAGAPAHASCQKEPDLPFVHSFPLGRDFKQQSAKLKIQVVALTTRAERAPSIGRAGAPAHAISHSSRDNNNLQCTCYISLAGGGDLRPAVRGHIAVPKFKALQ